MKQLNAYESPSVTVSTVSEDDILTMSSGFDGEYHTFSLFG